MQVFVWGGGGGVPGGGGEEVKLATIADIRKADGDVDRG